MPAECQIDDCGIIAIGRCGTCNRAFCMTHQARTPQTSYVDFCTSCMALSDATVKEERRGDTPDLFPKEARRRLIAANVSLVDIYVVDKTRVQTGSFRRKTETIKETKRKALRGWVLQCPVSWTWEERWEQTGFDINPAALVETGNEQRRGLTPVKKDADGDYVVTLGEKIADGWSKLNAELERLTGIPFDAPRG